MRTCSLCWREPEESSPSSVAFCRYHLAAKKNLEHGYEQWREAYGDITWEEYLKRLRQSGETGQWVKEVAELLTMSQPPERKGDEEKEEGNGAAA